MAVIQEHFITADEKERSGHLTKKKEKKEEGEEALKLTDYSTVTSALDQKKNFMFHKNPRQFDYKTI